MADVLYYAQICSSESYENHFTESTTSQDTVVISANNATPSGDNAHMPTLEHEDHTANK